MRTKRKRAEAKSEEADSFEDMLDQATKNISPTQRKTIRHRLQKTALEMGETPEQVLEALLASDEVDAPSNGGSSNIGFLSRVRRFFSNAE